MPGTPDLASLADPNFQLPKVASYSDVELKKIFGIGTPPAKPTERKLKTQAKQIYINNYIDRYRWMNLNRQ